MPLVPRQLNPRSRHGCSAQPWENPAAEKSPPRPPRPTGFLKAELKFVKVILPIWILLLAVLVRADSVHLRDLVMVAGARDNQLVGYGLVVGLNGEGDKDQIYTKQSVANMLQRYGMNISAATVSSKNVAVVMVTADIPAFAKPGSRIDVTVASLGDAKALTGGVLLQTPLIGADNKIYAVAQGAMTTGGFSAGTAAPAARPSPKIIQPPAKSRTAPWSNGKFPRRLFAITAWNCCCANPASRRPR